MKAIRGKKIILYLVVMITFIIAFVMVNSYAAESGSRSYSFRIQAHQTNAQTTYSLYRDVAKTNYSTPWYVNMTKSGEGSGTVTTYWLELKDGTNVSPDVDAKVGSHYHPAAYGTANSQNVWLTAENNNYNSTLYNVSGYWKAKSSY